MRKRTLLAAGIGAVAAAATAAAGLTRRFTIAEASMRPALEPGDWVLATRRRGQPARGDIVVFSIANDASLVKRVVGLPGERLTVANGQVHIDGATLAEPWAHGPTRPDLEVALDGDSVFLLGDNRGLSSGDSRTIGPVPVADVGWQVRVIYWPSGRAGPV